MHLESVLFLILLVFAAVLSKPFPFADSPRATCGYESCHSVHKTNLNVHLVPHSHDDVGWLKTVDQYFYGNKYAYQKGIRGVQHIIDSVVESLNEDPNRRFIQVETAFFRQWWKQQNEETRARVKDLVDTGRLEIIGGGWSMNDEAATNYQSIIDQFTLGLNTIDGLLGKCGRPKIGWQIDPFGHTREMASIFANLGYDGLFFTRADYRDIAKRQKDKDMEFMWRGNPDLGEDSDIFTSIIYNFYNAPSTFCWDVQCGDAPIVTDEESPEYNWEKRVSEFTTYVETQAKAYKTNNILVTMGGDFTYQAAEMYYMNMDKLIAGFKKFAPNINVIYSTPSCYLKAVNDAAKEKGVQFSLKTDDFMPLASDAHTYWTGFYTSRPNSKRFERQGNNLLQVTKQLAAFGKAKNTNIEEDLTDLKEVMGIMQHHDAITGTEKQHVADDYVKMLTRSTEKAQSRVDEVIAELLDAKADAPKIEIHSCLLANVSRCEPSTAKRFVVAVYNPLSRPVSHYVRLPVTSVQYTVIGMKGIKATHQIVPSIDKFDDMQEETPSSYELVFEAKSVPALGVKFYYVEKEDEDINKPDLIPPRDDLFTLGNSQSGFEINQETGLLQSVTLNGVNMPVKQEFLFYRSANGSNKKPEDRASGAYIFRPALSSREAILIADKATVQVYTGDLFDEVHQQFNSWIKQSIRVYKKQNHIEFDWLVGPLEYTYSDWFGVEVITRFKTDLKTDETFYTDSNGRGLIKRVRGKRDTFPYTNEEPVSGNYYPVTSRIVIKDEENKMELAILTDRAQGGSSLKDGEIELMVHRRLMNDDNFGVSEVLNETEFDRGVVVRGQHYLVLGSGSGKSAAAQQHDLVQRKLLEPWTFVGDATAEGNSMENLMSNMRFKFAGLTKALPDNVQILTLEPWGDNKLLLRLEHVFESEDDDELSKPVTVDLKDLLTLYKITDILETTLDGNQALGDTTKLGWNIKSKQRGYLPIMAAVSSRQARDVNDEELQITLNPMEIRTFVISVEKDDKTPEQEVCEGDECEEDCFDCNKGGGAAYNYPYSFMVLLLTVASLVY